MPDRAGSFNVSAKEEIFYYKYYVTYMWQSGRGPVYGYATVDRLHPINSEKELIALRDLLALGIKDCEYSTEVIIQNWILLNHNPEGYRVKE